MPIPHSPWKQRRLPAHQSSLEGVVMPNREKMMEAIDNAFAEHVKTLFAVLATTADAEAAQRFARGLKQACDAHDKAVAAIAILAPVA